jgi:2-(1,2-epoxy-1,2-dihydrophenyl)acetyl-CoA isomerase
MSLIASELTGSVLKITLNRPDKFNSFNREMALLLQEVLKEGEKNKGVRAIFLSAQGKAFCAGQDLAEAVDGSGPGIERIVREHYNPIIRLIRNIEKPVVCAVNGVAAGAGANIALACDIVISGSSASFIQAFSKIGLIPDSGGTFFLPRLIGFQRAAAIMMLGDKVSAAEALQMGMIYKVVADDTLQPEGMALASRLADMPTQAIGFTKRLLNASLSATLEQQLEHEMNMQVKACDTYDFQEGVKAFLGKRKPVFKGE